MSKSGLCVAPFRRINWIKVPDSWIYLSKFLELMWNNRQSRESLERKKLKKFRRLVRYVNKHSTYYQEIIKRYNIDTNKCVPTDFPVMNKSIMMDNFDRIVTDKRITQHALSAFLAQSTSAHDLFLQEYRVIRSSGSTGTMGYFVFSAADWLKGLAQGLRLKSFFKILEPRHFALICATRGHFGGEDMVATGIYNSQKNANKILVCETNDSIEVNVEKINAFQPKVLGGYATSLKILAEKQQAGLLNIAPVCLEAFGEVLSDEDKRFLQSVFKCDVTNLYGSSEHLLMGICKPRESEITLYDDDLIYEFLEDSTLVTNLFNYTLPLIRYKSSDILEVNDKGHAASPYIHIKSLIARSESRAAFINRVGGVDFITSYMIQDPLPGVRRFQLLPVDDHSFEFHVCLDSDIDLFRRPQIIGYIEAWLRTMLIQKMMDNIKFRIVVLDDIPVNRETRKFQLILPSLARCSSKATVA